MSINSPERDRKLIEKLRCLGTLWLAPAPSAAAFDLACEIDVTRLFRDKLAWTGDGVPPERIPGLAADLAFIAKQVERRSWESAKVIATPALRAEAAMAIQNFAMTSPFGVVQSFEMDDQLLCHMLFGKSGDRLGTSLQLRSTTPFDIARSITSNIAIIFDIEGRAVESIRFSRGSAENEVSYLIDCGLVDYENVAVYYLGPEGIMNERYQRLCRSMRVC